MHNIGERTLIISKRLAAHAGRRAIPIGAGTHIGIRVGTVVHDEHQVGNAIRGCAAVYVDILGLADCGAAHQDNKQAG